MEKFVCVEIGGDILPEYYLPRAVAELKEQFTVVGISRAWETPPVGCEGCDDFLNAAMLIKTDKSPDELKTIFRQIEARLERVRTKDKFSSRTIDIDTLIYDGIVIEPEIWEYAHLAVPISELVPDLSNKLTGEMITDVAEKMINERVIKLRSDVWLSP